MGLLEPMPFELNDGLIPGAGQKHHQGAPYGEKSINNVELSKDLFCQLHYPFLPYKHLDVILRLDNFRDGVQRLII